MRPDQRDRKEREGKIEVMSEMTKKPTLRLTSKRKADREKCQVEGFMEVGSGGGIPRVGVDGNDRKPGFILSGLTPEIPALKS